MMEERIRETRRRLMNEHAGSTTGTWRIYGEDPNCDLGGSHISPELETVTGTYSNVVEYALQLPSFFTWGGGGRIEKISDHLKNVDKVMHDPRIKELEKEYKETVARLDAITTELDRLKRG